MMKRLRQFGICMGMWFLFAGAAVAELPWQFEQHTRYMALGDSLAAGYGANPATNGYAYLLYQGGAFDTVPNTLLSNVGVPGATSQQVLDYQVPLALHAFRPHVITMTFGGNDLLTILNNADPNVVIPEFAMNLEQILVTLCSGLPGIHIYMSNLYTVTLPEVPQVDFIVSTFNTVVEQVTGGVAAGGCHVSVADVYSAFQERNGLLLIARNQAGSLEVHPTNSGYRVIAKAFLKAMNAN